MTEAVDGAAAPSPGRRLYAFAVGLACHGLFAAAVLAMMGEMAFGMSRASGSLHGRWAVAADAALLVQFPLLHSWLLGGAGGRALRRLGPRAVAGDMATTTYAAVASLQVLALFVLWSPSGVVWWRAGPWATAAILALQAGSWLLLLKAIVDAGFAVQTGLLGWRAVARGQRPVYPPMPTRGLFRWMRQPIYLAFALTTWTVPTWTPDQLVLATVLTGYCLLGPLLKERRFRARFGAAFEAYRVRTPYWLPLPRRAPPLDLSSRRPHL